MKEYLDSDRVNFLIWRYVLTDPDFYTPSTFKSSKAPVLSLPSPPFITVSFILILPLALFIMLSLCAVLLIWYRRYLIEGSMCAPLWCYLLRTSLIWKIFYLLLCVMVMVTVLMVMLPWTTAVKINQRLQIIERQPSSSKKSGTSRNLTDSSISRNMSRVMH